MDDARLEKLSHQVGGRFKLTALVQRRMQELLSDEHPFGERNIDNLFDNVLREIEEGKISLELPEAAALTDGKKKK